ncbi:MAG: endolytic transglycosylase MltG [Candidatus Aminicenantales bacterium]
MFLKSIRTVLLAAVIFVPALTGWLVRELAAPAAASPPAKAVFFEVAKGWSTRSVIAHLKSEGIVRDAPALQVACRLYFPDERFKAGEYLFTPPISTKDVLFGMFGGRIYLEPVTIPEGLTGQEIADLLRPGDPDGAAAFRRAFLDPGLIADLDPRAKDLEGYLFPNTYNMPRKAPEAELVGAMVAEFREIFDAGRRRRAAALGMSIRDVVILASLIEEETALPGERPLVSAVFNNRLKIGMKLDCDPTIVYALKREGRYTGRLLFRDLKFPSPYNTYLHAGLPPGPISNPGISSLDAALAPAPEGFLYFVARGDGSHRFSRTLGEHLDAVKKFRALKNR